MNILVRSVPILALCVIAFSQGVSAQPGFEVGAGAGIAAPIGGASEQRAVGPHFHLSVGYQITSQLQIRGDYTWAQLRGEPHPVDGYPPRFSNYGDLRLRGFSGHLVFRPTLETAIAPYAFLGVGGYSMRNMAGVPNPYGVVPGVNLGAGANVDVGPMALFTEARVEAVLSDFGAPEFRPTAYVPVAVGVRLPMPGPVR